jgi:hypothetical protein
MMIFKIGTDMTKLMDDQHRPATDAAREDDVLRTERLCEVLEAFEKASMLDSLAGRLEAIGAMQRAAKLLRALASGASAGVRVSDWKLADDVRREFYGCDGGVCDSTAGCGCAYAAANAARTALSVAPKAGDGAQAALEASGESDAPIAWRFKAPANDWWSYTDARTAERMLGHPDLWNVEPLYAARRPSPSVQMTDALRAAIRGAARRNGWKNGPTLEHAILTEFDFAYAALSPEVK